MCRNSVVFSVPVAQVSAVTVGTEIIARGLAIPRFRRSFLDGVSWPSGNSAGMHNSDLGGPFPVVSRCRTTRFQRTVAPILLRYSSVLHLAPYAETQ